MTAFDQLRRLHPMSEWDPVAIRARLRLQGRLLRSGALRDPRLLEVYLNLGSGDLTLEQAAEAEADILVGPPGWFL